MSRLVQNRGSTGRGKVSRSPGPNGCVDSRGRRWPKHGVNTRAWLHACRAAWECHARDRIRNEYVATVWVPRRPRCGRGVSAGRGGSASANWFTGTSFLSRSTISTGGSSATVGTGIGSASGTRIGEDRGLSVIPLLMRDRDSDQRNQNRRRHAYLQRPSRRTVSIQVFCWFRPASTSRSVSCAQAWRSGRTLSRFAQGRIDRP